MRLVTVESPFAGATIEERERNVAYARRCLRDCLLRGEVPFASHLIYAQPGVLDDDVPEERALGIAAGLAWGVKAAATVAYVDYGVSPGMKQGIAAAEAAGRPIEYRSLDDRYAISVRASRHDYCTVQALCGIRLHQAFLTPPQRRTSENHRAFSVALCRGDF